MALKDPAGFPEKEIREALAGWWEAELKDAADLAADAPAPKKPLSVLTPVAAIDSIRAVQALLAAEPAAGFELPPRLIKLGGYESFDEMADHLVTGMLAAFLKEKEKVDA